MDAVTSQNPCPHCGHPGRKKLCEDLPGVHTYIWACDGCGREYGREWMEAHHRGRIQPSGPAGDPPHLPQATSASGLTSAGPRGGSGRRGCTRACACSSREESAALRKQRLRVRVPPGALRVVRTPCIDSRTTRQAQGPRGPEEKEHSMSESAHQPQERQLGLTHALPGWSACWARSGC